MTVRHGGWEWDEAKDAENQRKHGLSFMALEDLDLDSIRIAPDTRPYDEPRYRMYARLAGRLHFVAFTRRGDRLRAISFRIANARERRRYEEAT